MRRVLAVLCGAMVLAGCGVPGGVEVEGRASQVSPPPTTSPTTSGTPASADAIAVLRADPQLNPKVKKSLVPCDDGYYPVTDRYFDFTGDGMAELVVTVFTCPYLGRDAMVEAKGAYVVGGGYAAFVYDLATKPPTRLLAVEDAPIELIPSKEDGQVLILIRSQWGPRDDPCCPTEQIVLLYRWDGRKFIEVAK